MDRAGDVNGDGIDDVIIGASRADPNGRDGAGASYVVFGTDQGFPAIIDLASAADLIIQAAAPNDFLGVLVSGAGDVDGDGIDDLIIGARSANPNGRDYAGAAYVVFGRGPEAALANLIADVEAAGLPDGLENALAKKLENAQGSLARGQSKGTAGKINAFINQVEAQRGNQIDDADADEWIADAQAIIDALRTA